MCYPMDVDLAMDAHRERQHSLEVANRLALSDSNRPSALLQIRHR